MIPLFENVEFSQFTVEQRLTLIGWVWDTFEDPAMELSSIEFVGVARNLKRFSLRIVTLKPGNGVQGDPIEGWFALGLPTFTPARSPGLR